MLKRNIFLYMMMTVIMLVFSFFIRFTIKDRSISSASEITDLANIDFQFFGVFGEDDLPDEDKVKQMLDDSRYILEVTPTGKLKVTGECIMQEVKINQHIKNDSISDDIIWIISDNGFWYKKETDTIYNWGRTNIMTEGSSYVVVLSVFGYNQTVYYYNEFPFGALRCSHTELHSYIDAAQKYNYAQLEQFDFFAADEAAINKMYKLKEYIFRYLNEMYDYYL